MNNLWSVDTTRRLLFMDKKFVYSEKATKFCEISTVDLSYAVTDKYTVEILQNFVAFSEYMNFNLAWFFFQNLKFIFWP